MFVFSICSFLLLCCGAPEKTKLKSSVPKEKMIPILMEIHLLEARAEEFKTLNDSFITAKSAAYDSIFSKYNISKSDFLNTFEAYEKNPEEMDLLYEKIIDSFSVLEANFKQESDETVEKAKN
ncbi:MAG: DUF4296 domain-containing protein [Chitinophagales bacterium]